MPTREQITLTMPTRAQIVDAVYAGDPGGIIPTSVARSVADAVGALLVLLAAAQELTGEAQP